MSRIDELIRELCPEGVPYRELGRVIEHLRTGLNPRSNFTLNGPQASGWYVTVRELAGFDVRFHTNTDRLDPEALEVIQARSQLKTGDVLFSGTGTIGRTALVTEARSNWNIKEGVYALTPNTGEIQSRFLIYLFHSESVRREVLSKSAGSTVQSIPFSALQKVKIPVPPLEVQREIVSILDKFTQLLAELEAELEARRTQYETLRDQYFFEQVKLQASLMTIAEIGEGGLLTDGDWIESKDQDPSGTVKLAQLADILEGTYQEKSQRFMTSIRADDLGCTLLEPHGILIARMPEPIGRACLFPQGRQPTVTVVDVALLRVKNPDINQRFVMHAINSHPIRRQIAARQSGGTRQRISRSKLATVQLPIPSVFEQNRMADLFDSLFLMSSDLSKGLPAEIEARRKQYEYYRNNLLTFKELDAA